MNVFILRSVRPSSYQARPISPPPRTCATANTTPRSSSDSRGTEKYGSMLISYAPYPYSSSGAGSAPVPAASSVTASRRHTSEIGIRVPSSAVAHSRRCT